MIQVFSPQWFELHQKRILRFANNSAGRHVLKINGNRSSVGNRKILKIDPHAITWLEGYDKNEPIFSTEFRTHEKFAKRLYYGLNPIWKGMHIWDQAIANKLNPAWNLGFDTLGPIYPAGGASSPVDGVVFRSGVNETFPTIRTSAGNGADATFNPDGPSLTSTSTSNQYSVLQRTLTCFDTSPLTSAATVSAGTVSLSGGTKSDTFNTPAAPAMVLCASAPASTAAVANADYNIANWAATEYASRITYASFASGYNDMALNAAGLSNLNKTGVCCFGQRISHDYDNSGPTWSTSDSTKLPFFMADQAGTTNDPKLVVTYTLPTGYKNMLLLGVG